MTMEELANDLRRVPRGAQGTRRVTDENMTEIFGGSPSRDRVGKWLKSKRLNFKIEFSPTLPGWCFRRKT
jgi:hypothetical protein